MIFLKSFPLAFCKNTIYNTYNMQICVNGLFVLSLSLWSTVVYNKVLRESKVLCGVLSFEYAGV